MRQNQSARSERCGLYPALASSALARPGAAPRSLRGGRPHRPSGAARPAASRGGGNGGGGSGGSGGGLCCGSASAAARLRAAARMGSEVLTPEMLTLTSIVSVKIQSCVTRYEDEEKKKKK